MENLTCPKCEGKTFKKGTLGASFGQVHMFTESKRGKSSSISGEYCDNCGYILSLYVDHPKNID